MSTTTLRSHIKQCRQRIDLRAYAKNALGVIVAAILLVLPELITDVMQQTAVYLEVFETAPRLEAVLATIVSIGGTIGGIDGAAHTLFLYAVLGGTAWYLGFGAIIREHRDVLMELLAATVGIIVILGVYHLGVALINGRFNPQNGPALTVFAMAVGINQLHVWFFASVGAVFIRGRGLSLWPTVAIVSVVVAALEVYSQAMEGVGYLHREFHRDILIGPIDLAATVVISLWFVFGAILFLELAKVARERMREAAD